MFRDVSARYRDNLPLVLQHMDLRVPGGSSCGLVGRTGSGKSSTLLALFRIFDLAGGAIEIDGVDVSRVPLSVLRRHALCIVPQDPFFFVGSLKSNLDPFGESNDADVYEALRLVQFDVQAVPGGLEHPVAESGSNFSMGERQLLCLARAMLRKTRVVAFDEATASVDLKRSVEIGATMKQLFAGRTLFLIAHRLDVVSSLDLVAVMSSGSVVEVGHPASLIASGKGEFWDLWRRHQDASSSSS